MQTLITRKIEPSIERYFKYLFFLTPVFLFNFSFLLNILQFILVIAIIGMALYEIKIYSDNNEFISIIKIDKHLFLYDLNIKYLKIFLFISLFLMISNYLKNLILLNTFSIVFLLFSFLFVIILAINEREILKTDMFSIIIKYLILIIIMVVCNNISTVYTPIIFTQVLYIFIIGNHNYVSKTRINISSLINISMLALIELSLIIYSNNLLYIFLKSADIPNMVFLNTTNVSDLLVVFISTVLFVLSITTVLIVRRLLISHFNLNPELKYNLKVFIFLFIFFIAVDLFSNMFVFMHDFNGLFIIFVILFIYSVINLILIAIDKFIFAKIFNHQIIKRINDNYDSWV